MRNGVALWRTLLVLGVALVVMSGRDQVFGQGGTWIAKAPIPTPRVGLAVGVVSGVLYAVGGEIVHAGVGGYIEILSTVEAYDPSTNSWSSKAPLPTPRGGLTVGVVNGILYALGGFREESKPFTDTMDAYDPVRNMWTAKGPMAVIPRGGAVGVVKGTLYVVGGSTTGPTGLVDAYDPTTNLWTVKPPMPSPRTSLGVGVVNGILYAVGGSCCGPSHPLGTVEAYDPTTNTWTAKASMPTPRYNLAVGVANQILYAVGGHGGPNGESYVNVVEAYDPARNVWTTKTPLPENRNLVGLGSVNGFLHAVGGVKLVSSGPDSPPCGFGPCFKFVDDPITYAFKPLP